MPALGYVGSRRSKLLFAGGVYAALTALIVAFVFPLVWVSSGTLGNSGRDS